VWSVLAGVMNQIISGRRVSSGLRNLFARYTFPLNNGKSVYI